MTEFDGRAVGNSPGVLRPKPVLQRLNLKDRDTLHLTEALDGSIRVSADDEGCEAQMRAASEGMRAYRNTLRELAK